MTRAVRVIVGIVSALTVFGTVLLWQVESRADGDDASSSSSDGDRCPATSKSHCDGLMVERLGF